MGARVYEKEKVNNLSYDASIRGNYDLGMLII